MMFRGMHAIRLDAKGRMVLPTRYRAVLQKNMDEITETTQVPLVITIDPETPCLLGYPLSEWESIEQKIEALPSFHPAARRIQRLLMGHATEVEVDTQGRILIPGLLREYASLEKNIVVIGQGKKFELWEQAHWNTARDQWLAQEEEIESQWPLALQSLSL